VIDDIPRRHARFPLRLLPDFKFWNASRDVYTGENIFLTRRYARGSTSAFLEGVRLAKIKGHKYVLMHLDDNVYLPIARSLVSHAITAMDDDPGLGAVKLTCFPMVGSFASPEKGNETLLQRSGDIITFSETTLRRKPYPDFTLWWSPFDVVANSGTLWPITFWTVIYSIDFLEALLAHPPLKQRNLLTYAESYYRDKTQYAEFLKRHGNLKFGFINMQFAGYEMHQNEGHWHTLMSQPNVEVR